MKAVTGFKTLLPLIFLLVSINFSYSAQSLPDKEAFSKIREVIRDIFSDPKILEAVKGKRVAVGGFVDDKKNFANLSLSLAKQTEKSIVEAKKGINLVKISELEPQVSAWHIGVNGLVSEESYAQYGKLLNIDFFCVGSYAIDKKTIKLTISIIYAPKEEVIIERIAELELTPALLKISKEHIQWSEIISRGLSKEGDIKLEIWSEKGEYGAGDKIKFFAKTDKDCYLTLVHVDALGKASILFPNDYDISNLVKGEKTYQIPSESSGVDFIASEPFGYEIARGVATANPNFEIKDAIGIKIYTDDENPFADFLIKSPKSMRGINMIKKTPKKEKWSEAVIKIKILP